MVNRIDKFIVFFIIGVILTGCDNDFEIPVPENKLRPKGNVITIAATKSGLDRFQDNETVSFNTDLLMEGFVISTDEGGNFFKELILQDKSINPTAGIHFLIDERALHTRFPYGSKLFIQLNGLSVGYGNGVVKLGKLQENEIVALTAFEIDQHVFRTTERVEIVPLELTANTLTRANESLLVKFNNMQFGKALLGVSTKTLAAENTDSFDGFRPIVNCDDDIEVVVCTSTFSSFKSLTLPSKSGDITGVLSRDFGDDFFVIKMNSATDLNFTSTNRCDPIFFECNTGDFKKTELVFSEDFETITNENLLEPLGWINVNVTGDEKVWTDKKIINVNNRVLTISAFNTNLRPLNAWLITPEFDNTEKMDAFVQFRIRTLFNNGTVLKVLGTTKFTGDPQTTNWELMPVEIPIKSSNYVKLIQDVSCLSGKIRIAFQYKGFDPVGISTYQIDNVEYYKATNDK